MHSLDSTDSQALHDRHVHGNVRGPADISGHSSRDVPARVPQQQVSTQQNLL